MKGLIPYALAFVAVGGVAVAQQAYDQPSPPKQMELPAESEGPRRLTISVSVSDPADLKVKEGDRVKPGQLLADRGRERRRLEAQAKQLNLVMHRLELSTITPPLPPATPPALISPTYLEQNAAIDQAKTSVEQAESAIQAKHQEMDYLAQLPNLDPLILDHESVKLNQLQLEHTAAVRDYQLALGQRSTAEYEHSRTMAIDASTRNRDQLSYQSQWAQYEQRLRDRDYQLSQTQLKLDEIQNEIATLSVVRSPYAGRIRRVKWLGQGTDGLLSAEISLMVRASAGTPVSGQLNGLPDADYPDGNRPVIRD